MEFIIALVVAALVCASLAVGPWVAYKISSMITFEVNLSKGGEGSLEGRICQVMKNSGYLSREYHENEPTLTIAILSNGHPYAEFIANDWIDEHNEVWRLPRKLDSALAIFMLAMYYEVRLPFVKHQPFPTMVVNQERHDEYEVSRFDPAYDKIKWYSGRIAFGCVKLKRLAEVLRQRAKLYLG